MSVRERTATFSEMRQTMVAIESEEYHVVTDEEGRRIERRTRRADP